MTEYDRVKCDEMNAVRPTHRELRQCKLCGCTLDMPNDHLSADCGGDCWGCVSEIEFDGGAAHDGVSLEEYRADRRDARAAEETEFLKRQERDLCLFPDNRAGRRAAASKRRNKRKW